MNILKKANTWKIGILLFILCTIVISFSLYTRAEETDKEVTIYGLSSSNLDQITIPDHLAQSHQLTFEAETNVTYTISSGNTAKVSKDGLITPKYTYWKRHSGFSSSVSEGEDYDYYTISAGDTVIIAKTTNASYSITVHVKDYSITYCDEIMDAYLSEHITEGMTDYEIMQAIVKFPASYDYSASYSSVYSMIINGGGDCWASTSAIITLCDKLGIKAWSRNANMDLGAGSGHRNAMAELNGTYYELEAGYAMSKGDDGYRPYNVSVRKTLFSYYYNSSSSSITIYQYDGDDTTGVLEIPETIDGRTVTGIYKSAFSSTKFSEIRLPDTLTSIGDFAFSSCSNLASITIPASVTSIGSSVFTNCKELNDISIADDNTSYQVINQVIYSKDKTTLITCPNAEQVTIPATVTKIADYAFYYNTNLKQITIPESVTEMGEGAFGNCSGLTNITIEGNGLSTIGNHCFRSNNSLSAIRLPASVKVLGAYALSYCSKLKHIYFMGNAPEFGNTIDGTFYDKVFYSCTANAYYPDGDTTWTDDVLTNHDGTITWSAWSGTEVGSAENTDPVKKDTNQNDTQLKDDKNDDANKETNQNNKTDTNEKVSCYDQKTGITLSFIEGDNKNATLVSVNKKQATGNLVIPATLNIDGTTYTIKAIAKTAFKNNQKITKVTIGNNVKIIGKEAFSGCKNLKSVKLGKNITTIGDKAFYNCCKITGITIPSKVNKIE